MSGFLEVLKGSAEFEKISGCLESRRLPMGVIGLSQVHKAHYISSLIEKLGEYIKKGLDFSDLTWYNTLIKCEEQKPVGWKEPIRELPVGARQRWRPSRIHSVSSALNQRDL